MDGFRFDIMGHIMVPTMRKIQAALGALTLEKDGVDGAGLYLYGEAWDFGEVRLPTLVFFLSKETTQADALRSHMLRKDLGRFHQLEACSSVFGLAAALHAQVSQCPAAVLFLAWPLSSATCEHAPDLPWRGGQAGEQRARGGAAQVACNQRGQNAAQLNIGGTRLGSFSDQNAGLLKR